MTKDKPRKAHLIIGPHPLPVKDRPQCNFCAKRLHPKFWTISQAVTHSKGVGTVTFGKYFRGTYGLFNAFCGPKCAEYWALRQFRRLQDEHPALDEPPIPEAWIEQARAFMESGGWGFDFRPAPVSEGPFPLPKRKEVKRTAVR